MLAAISPDLPDQAAHSRLRQLRTVLITQPLPHPPGRVALLTRRGQVLDQPRPDLRLVRPEHRRLPDWDLARRRCRVGQRLPHRAPVHLVPIRQRTDRQPFNSMVSADTFEHLHPRSRFHLRPS
ncbi:hypothetical protein REH70_00005 [Cellulomonas sp. ATA003]|nr:hypothetical protein [Cellulomonas sp. ATA003]WNB85782.1 hypothetical protein REH70_00005 [Cellulomonas sp. ATA003]